MIKKIFFALVVVAIISAFFLIPHESGEVAITYDTWHFETNLWMFIAGLIIILILLKISVSILKFLFDIPSFIDSYKKHRQLRKYETNLEYGILSLVTKKWDLAYKYLNETNKNNSHIISLLANAIAASKNGNLTTALELLKKANETFSSHIEPIAIIKSEILLDHNKYNDALTELNTLLIENGESKARLFQLIKAYEKTYSWHNLLELSNKIKNYKVLNKNDLEKSEISWATNLINMQAEYQLGYDSLVEILNSLPNNIKNNNLVLLAFLKQSEKENQDANVDYAIEQSLTQDWNEYLLIKYRESKGKDYSRRLKNIEKLMKFHPNNPQMLLTVALFALRAKLWGKGKEYLLKCLILNDKFAEARLQLEILQNNLGEIDLPKTQIEAYLLAYPHLINEKID